VVAGNFFHPIHRKNTIKQRRIIMFNQIMSIIDIVVKSFLHVWPYLLLTIPLAVAVQMSGAARYINRALKSRPVTAILLAGIVGAFSPFCSCGVIPVIAALLMGGVPLAPVMTFWVASPSMDPEIFFLSVATIGWELAVWRLVGTLVLSLSAGFITQFMVQQGWLGHQILRTQKVPSIQSRWEFLTHKILRKIDWRTLKERLLVPLLPRKMAVARVVPVTQSVCCAATALVDEAPFNGVPFGGVAFDGVLPGSASGSASETQSCQTNSCGSECSAQSPSFLQRLFRETWQATAMVVKFMALAFFLKALITLYVPSEWIVGLLGSDNAFAIVMAAVIGVPVYTSNLTALPMISGLLAQGMNPAAALAFLIAGPMTTLPAMAAVWGLVTRRVFILYVSFALIGALVLGYAYSFLAGF